MGLPGNPRAVRSSSFTSLEKLNHVSQAETETSPCIPARHCRDTAKDCLEIQNPDGILPIPVPAVRPIAPSPFVQMKYKTPSAAATQSSRGRRLMGATREPHQSLFRNQKSQSKPAVTHGSEQAQIRPRLDNKGQILFGAFSENFHDLCLSLQAERATGTLLTLQSVTALEPAGQCQWLLVGEAGSV